MPKKLLQYKQSITLLDAIEKSRNTTLARFIYSLGIIHVGEYAAKLLAGNFENIEDLYRTKPEKLIGIKQMGEKIADSIAHFFNDPENLNTLKMLKGLGLKISNPDFKMTGTGTRPLDGMTFVLTFMLPESRKEVKHLIEQMGGHASGSVSGSTDYLVMGESPGSKFKKANSLGVSIISYEELMKMIGEGELK